MHPIPLYFQHLPELKLVLASHKILTVLADHTPQSTVTMSLHISICSSCGPNEAKQFVFQN